MCVVVDLNYHAALRFGLNDEEQHSETKIVTVTLTGPFNDSGKSAVCVLHWRVVKCAKMHSVFTNQHCCYFH